MFFAINGVICLAISLTIPIIVGDSFSNLFNNLSLLNNIDITQVLVAKYSVSILILCFVFFLIAVICFVLSIYDYMNTKPLHLRKTNYLNWKKTYKRTEFYDKIMEEMENAYMAVQNLKQRVQTLEKEKEKKNE